MSEQQVVAIMASSTSESDWNLNCDAVKAAFGGDYPEFWFRAVLCSGVAYNTQQRWES